MIEMLSLEIIDSDFYFAFSCLMQVMGNLSKINKSLTRIPRVKGGSSPAAAGCRHFSAITRVTECAEYITQSNITKRMVWKMRSKTFNDAHFCGLPYTARSQSGECNS